MMRSRGPKRNRWTMTVSSRTKEMTQRTERSGITRGLRGTVWPERAAEEAAAARARESGHQTNEFLYHSATRLGKHSAGPDSPCQSHVHPIGRQHLADDPR